MNTEDQDQESLAEFTFQTVEDESLTLPEAGPEDQDDGKLYTRHSPAMRELKERVVDYVSTKNYRPVKPRVIARKLGLDEAATRGISKAIRFLSQEGRVRQGPNHVVFPPPRIAEKN